MARIFISYRRDDSAFVAQPICDELQERFGEGSVFIDVDSIPYGVDFQKKIDAAVAQCDVLLAVIGDRWLDARFSKGPHEGKRRLEDAQDFVRLEIVSAQERGIPLIPVLGKTLAMSRMQHAC